MSTTRLLKAILPAACLWTGLREVEGFGYDKTLEELKTLYPVDEGQDEQMEDDSSLLPESVPESIREMADCRNAIKALGSMIWSVSCRESRDRALVDTRLQVSASTEH